MRSIFSIANRSVAQLGRALRSGRRGRRFESCHSDFFIAIPQSLKYGLCGFSLLGQGPVFIVEFFVFRKTEL